MSNHRFSCTTFTAEGKRQRIAGNATARAVWDSDVTLSSPDRGRLPVGSFRASAQGPASLAIKANGKDGEEYTYLFERTYKFDTRPANGRVIVSVRKGPVPPTFFATGICDFVSEFAR